MLLVVFSDAGHLNPMLALGQHLEAAGHELTVFSVQDDVTQACRRAGLRARCFATARTGTIARDEAQRSVKLAQQLGNERWMKRWLTLSLVDSVPAAVAALEDLVRDARPALVVTDAMAYAGAIVATRNELPWAAISTGVMSLLPPDDPNSGVFRALEPAREKMATAMRVSLTFRGSDVVAPRCNVMFAAPSLFPEAAAGLSLVGAALPLAPRGNEHPFPWERLPADGRPIVLACFGSHLSPRPEIYPALAAALGPDEAFFVFVLKDLIREPFVGELPPHVLPVEYAPQLQLLERSAAMVHHGGANSTMECLSLSVPMLVVPLGYDQHMLGRAVVRAGVGLMLDQTEATTSALRSALQRLLDAAGPRRELASVPAWHVNGAARAAALLEDLRADQSDRLILGARERK